MFIQLFEREDEERRMNRVRKDSLKVESTPSPPRTPKDVQVPLPAPPPVSPRGVEEVALRAKDWRAFEVTDSAGECIMYVEWPKPKATQARIDWLWRQLDKEDPQPQLHVID